jgi:flagellar biogenesis protein FliO
MEQKRRAPWKLVALICLALLPVSILAIAGRSSDARVFSAPAAPVAEPQTTRTPLALTLAPSIGAAIAAGPLVPGAVTSALIEVETAAPPKAVPSELDFLSDSPKTAAPEGGIPWVRLIVGVFAVAMLIGVGVYLLKKANGGVIPGRRGDRHVKVLETRPLGRKAQVHLVTVGGRALVLTSAGENVTKLAEFPEEDLLAPEGAELSSGAGERDAGRLTFKSIVKNMVESCASVVHGGGQPGGLGSSKGQE